jgi:hypothetical protein
MPSITRKRTVDGMPECRVRFPVAEFTAATLSRLHELSSAEINVAEGSKGKRHQRNDSPGPGIPAHLDVWLPSTIFRTWTVGGMSRELMMGDGDLDLKVCFDDFF